MKPELPNWPILMDTWTAARYLSISENSFRHLAEQHGLHPVPLGMASVRWRRTDLDEMVDQLAQRGELVNETEAADLTRAALDRVSNYRRKPTRRT